MALTEEGLMKVPGMLSRFVRLAGGTRAHYMTAGETGPAVILLHGGLIGWSGLADWRFVAPALGANGFRVYCPDLPGFGLTETARRAYPDDYSGFVDFLHDFATALCLDRFHLSGNSMGSSVTVHYTTDHPDRVASFILISGGIGDLVPPEVVASADQRPADQRPQLIGLFDGSPESMSKMVAPLLVDMSVISQDFLDMLAIAGGRHTDGYMGAVTARLEPDADARARLRTAGRFDRLTIPGLCIYGVEDVITPHYAGGYPQEDALSGVQFFYPERTGHLGQLDQPELLARVFAEFFGQGKVSWDTAQRAGLSTRRAPNPDLVALPDPAS